MVADVVEKRAMRVVYSAAWARLDRAVVLGKNRCHVAEATLAQAMFQRIEIGDVVIAEYRFDQYVQLAAATHFDQYVVIGIAVVVHKLGHASGDDFVGAKDNIALGAAAGQLAYDAAVAMHKHGGAGAAEGGATGVGNGRKRCATREMVALKLAQRIDQRLQLLR